MLTSNFSALFKKITRPKKISRSNGFTLFEVLIVIGIISILSSFLIGFSRQSNRILLMSSAQTKISNMMSRAKFLSIQTYFQTEDSSEDIVCAHGVHIDIDNQEAFIFQKISNIDDGCSTNKDDYLDFGGSDVRLTGELSQVSLNSSRILFSSENTTLDYVIFIPPDPIVKINGSNGVPSDESASVVITDIDGETQLIVTVNDEGQVKTE